MTVVDQHMNTDDGNQVTRKIFTVANLVSFVRLCMAPLFLYLLFHDYNIAATVVFAVAASTDFLDGQIARRTHTVSRLGKILDPIVDRVLMITGVAGLYLVGRLPLWIIIVVLVRDLFLLGGGAWLLFDKHIRIDVIYPGKFATTFLFIGFAALLLNMPLLPGLGLCDISWLPGFNSATYCWGIWFIYAGLCLSLGVTVYYVYKAIQALKTKDQHGTT